MICRLLVCVAKFVSRWLKWVIVGLLAVIVLSLVGIISTKVYQTWDNDPARGAVALTGGASGESESFPEYLDQGWKAWQSLWFYNTTQGSALLPYDFLLALEQPDPDLQALEHPDPEDRLDIVEQLECKRDEKEGAWFLCDENIDRLRYLPQRRTLFNPGALPVGFVIETYEGKDYVGYTCAACHTGQVDFKGRALRIDGGPAMADMVKFLTELTLAMEQTLRKADEENPRLKGFVERVRELNNDYDDAAKIEEDLKKWTNVRTLYNIVNSSTYEGNSVDYGYARLDAFGRIYNRVLQHAINREQVAKELRLVTVEGDPEQRLLNDAEIEKVLLNVGKPGDIILRDDEFWEIISNLQSDESGFPGLNDNQILRVLNKVFNSPNAPVSYPFLWDISHSDYVQWNAIAKNAPPGPLGRNAGEVTGVFAILDWQKDTRWWTGLTGFSLSGWISGQSAKRDQIYFKSSIDLFNLQRLESHLTSLKSPRWPFCRKETIENGSTVVEYYLPTGLIDEPVDGRDCNAGDKRINEEMADKGQLIYAKMCQVCHDVIDRNAWDRMVIGKMVAIDAPQSTDDAMASNGAGYMGKSGNFKDTYQAVDVGKVVVREDAPVAQILTATTKGVVATPDADKWWPRSIVEWIYTLVMSFADNPIKSSVKAGFYNPDTTAKPYDSLRAYRARSLNGIWATAPYLHNGSVPSLYDLLLPAKPHSLAELENDSILFIPGNPRAEDCSKIRPKSFMVGSREFDPEKIGFKSDGNEGFEFKTDIRGNWNTGHEYGACMTDEDRWALVEYLKSL
ncbi:MAG: di-heme-cytochrome C peroxidase [Planctomycetota bacterium]|nr:di-heme-cytochrome C peroxidase [Planctomycetota bacterium]